MNAETTVELAQALDALTPRQREALTLRCYGATYREIGEAMGISTQAAFYLIRRARKRINEINTR